MENSSEFPANLNISTGSRSTYMEGGVDELARTFLIYRKGKFNTNYKKSEISFDHYTM